MKAISLSAPLVACASALVLAGCSSFDFFGFEDNAPLHVVERPDDYTSGSFGAEIAPTSLVTGDENMDLVGVSAGRGYPTVFYRLAAGGKLVDVEDPWRDFLLDSPTQAGIDGSGSSLVGLPRWDRGDGQYRLGCVAVGEPLVADENGRVTIVCEDEPMTLVEILSSASGITDDLQRRWFGHQLAAVRPLDGENWLLAVATERVAMVFSSATAHSQIAEPSYGSGEFLGEVSELAAGRLADGRIFLVVTAFDASEVYRMHLFVQDAPQGSSLPQVACVNRTGAEGFAGRMATGDLDRDGNDELLVSAAAIDGREEAVYLYDVLALADAGPTCNSDAPDPLTEIVPRDGPLAVTCEEGCGFGTALAIGDIATDDDGPEVIVGAPGAKVEGKRGAGAVYVFRGADVIAGGAVEVAGQVAHSSPSGGAGFGGGLAVAPMAGRNELLIGVTKKGQLVIAFCTGVGEDIEQGADVTSNASGTVVSTRCRPK